MSLRTWLTRANLILLLILQHWLKDFSTTTKYSFAAKTYQKLCCITCNIFRYKWKSFENKTYPFVDEMGIFHCGRNSGNSVKSWTDCEWRYKATCQKSKEILYFKILDQCFSTFFLFTAPFLRKNFWRHPYTHW